ncbi:MAG: DUF3015 domain-containing protein [Proteobacteria bacterium]|nr:MAG: DUF3015 domain-containing protein [Pseudomonadota bacterium]
MRQHLWMICASLALVTASSAMADNFGMAGCGLGSMVLQSNGKEQIFVGTTNGTSASQTFGITSGTSNCKDDAATVAAMYISVNQEALKRDIARGNGESISGLASILNCSDSDALGTSLQRNFGGIFQNTISDSKEVAVQIRQSVYSDTTLASSCKAI